MNSLDFMERCPTCPGTNRCVRGDGPVDARVMCVGEEPGRDEDEGGRPFIGMAGKEFNLNYLPLAGLHRSLYDAEDSSVYVTNARKCRMGQNKTPTYNEIRACSDHWMPQELKVINPTVVILMGASPCKLLGRDGIDLEAEHGIPRWGEIYDWEGWIVPINHPAAGLHDGAMMTPMLEDWERLEPWLRAGTWVWPEYTRDKQDYRLCRSVADIFHYFEDYRPTLKYNRMLAGIDTETHARVRWSIQASTRPGTGMMVQTDTGTFDPEQLKALRHWLHRYEWAMHNADADIWVADLLDLPNQPYRDTMQEAYQFQNLPQKLKAIIRRVLGRSRPSWEELVTPWSRAKLYDWMVNGLLYAEENWQQRTERVHKTTGKPLKPIVKKSEAEKTIVEVLGHMLKNPEYPADMTLWQKVEERLGEDWMKNLQGAVGPMPARGIAHMPMGDARDYGCADADDTLAVALLFETMRKQFKVDLDIQPQDRDN